MNPKAWSPEQITTMAQMWDQGCSGTEIGEKIGKNRSSTLGKIYRMYEAGYPFARARMTNSDRAAHRRSVAQQPAQRVKRPQRYTERPSKPRAEKTRLNAARMAALSEPVDVTGAKVWTERLFGECAFPIAGEGAGTLSCCAKTPMEATYCLRHQAVMYQAPPPSASTREAALTTLRRRIAA